MKSCTANYKWCRKAIRILTLTLFVLIGPLVKGNEILLGENGAIVPKGHTKEKTRDDFQNSVSGTITDENGTPLPGATIIEKGTTNGVQTDFDGNYTITVTGNNPVLVFSYVGFASQEIPVNGQSTINVALITDTELLDEVVVTALGITKEKKALAYATQQVESENLVRASNGNINTALQGKVAGVTVTTSGGITGNARLELRGSSSLQGDDQVLWVIDGVPFSTEENTSDAQDTFGGFSNGGGVIDINPDDIESISVLKGGQAAALYGSRGANGVVLITTKTGKRGAGLGISYTGTTTFSQGAYFLDLQKEYGQGVEGVYSPDARNAWGPRFDGQLRPAWTGENLPYEANNRLIEDFMRTAVNTRHSISFTKGSENGNFKASILSDNNEEVYQNSGLKKLNFDLRASQDITPWLNVDAKVSYFRTRGQQRPEVGIYSYISQLYATPANIRTEDLSPGFEVVNGFPTEILYGPNRPLTANPNPNVRNPYFVQIQQVNNDERNRMFGYLAGNFKFSDNLTLRLKYGLDFFRYQRVFGQRYEDNVAPTVRPNIDTYEQFFKEENMEFLLTFNKDLNNDFSLTVSAGGNLMKNGFEALDARSGKLVSPNDFFLNAGTNITVRQEFSSREIQSLYGFVDFSYKDYLFLTATGRNDWSSALASLRTDNEFSYFYPSAGLSALVSEMTELPNWVNYLKLRGSWAQVGKDTDPYNTNPVFRYTPGAFGLLASETPSVGVIADLRPEISTTYEAGIDVRLFDNRFSLEATYYDERTKNQIVQIADQRFTGFNSIFDNAGLITNKGIELIATVVPIRTDDFNLGLTFNFAKNEGILEELLTPEDDGEFFRDINFSNTIRNTEGERLGDIYGSAYVRDANGEMVIGADGLPVETQEDVKLGNIQPDFSGSIGIDANYKNFALSALFAMKEGGDILSITEANATGSGNSLKSISLGREPFFAAGNQADGSPNVQIVSPDAYWGRVSGIDEEFIYDASFMKLAELSLSYSFPKQVLDKIGFVQSARLSLIGRNLFYLYRDTPGTVPDATFNSTFGAQAFDFSAVPVTRSIGFALNLNL
ncbi:SusC/RagA family TonB-linked outer membrane protein [Flagellimonas sp. HMM57]|uniref:SusC/RagA family TonB-linked outer membrane protein n=1 Tax=unclassified Flagellimonas TaxID=2644544 RepID=UPI0013D7DCDA|nr:MULTISPECIES: SusC/RagA family TonB-linked outer membrane protein [unclassified Flagellimonas]UII74747.1 SusC/RagA family TonB-linked outer membrane protein [Flagellimonas sp. HMM57]